jgi:hypothetical protein
MIRRRDVMRETLGRSVSYPEVKLPQRILGEGCEGALMEPFLPPLRNRLRRWLASLSASLGKLVMILKPQAAEVRSQRMCPFCGLITPRAKRLCLECGKPLRGVPSGRKDAPQG